MNSEPEVGSVIEARTAATQERVSLGHVERTCLRCGKSWGDDRNVFLCPKCGFNECSVREIPPTLLEIKGWGIGAQGRDAAILGDALAVKSKTKLAVTDAELDSLRSLRSAIVVMEQRLADADRSLHQLVDRSDENREVFAFLQSAVHALWDGNIGDFELRSTGEVTALTLAGPLKALREEVDRVLARYESVRSQR